MSNKPVQDIPTAVQEFIMASVFHWTLKEIRGLSSQDHRTLMPLALNKFVVDCAKLGIGS